MSVVEFYPCPFCGSYCIYEAHIPGDKNTGTPDDYHMFCTECLCIGPSKEKFVDCIDAWNDRDYHAKKA